MAQFYTLDSMLAEQLNKNKELTSRYNEMINTSEFKKLYEEYKKAENKYKKESWKGSYWWSKILWKDDLKKLQKNYNKAKENLQTYTNNYMMGKATDIEGDIDIPEIEDTEIPEPEIPDKPGTEKPGTETPGTETPGTETPGTETPGTETPGTETPGNVNNVEDDNNSNIESPINSISYGSYLNFIQNMQEKQWQREDERTKMQWEREDTAYQRGAEDARKAGYNLNLMGSPAVAPTSSGITSSTGLDYSLINSMASQESSKYASDMSAWIAEYNGTMQKYLAEYNGNVDKAIEKFKAEYNAEIEEFVMYYEEMFFEGNMDQKERDRIANIITSALATFSLAQFKKK